MGLAAIEDSNINVRYPQFMCMRTVSLTECEIIVFFFIGRSTIYFLFLPYLTSTVMRGKWLLNNQK